LEGRSGLAIPVGKPGQQRLSNQDKSLEFYPTTGQNIYLDLVQIVEQVTA